MINWVISKYNMEVDWVYKINNINNIFIYDKNAVGIILDTNNMPVDPTAIPADKGHESSVYLKYIINNYDYLPDFTFFTHGEEYSSYHSGSILDKYNEVVNEINAGKLYYNINDTSMLESIVTNNWYNDILVWYNQYIETYIPLNSLPHTDWTVGYRGSSQFLVHKSLIKKLPKEFYENLYNWIITTDMPIEKSGKFMEWTWHIFWAIYPNL